MKKLLTLFTICTTVLARAQILKTATDDFYEGKITYQYYEDPKTSKYVKHGTFKYIKSLKSDFGSYSQVATGQFKNGYRHGTWNFSITQIDFPNDGGSYTTGKTSSIQTFKEGMPNGLWQVSNTWKARRRVFNVWKPFEQTYSENASTTFVNGYASGVTTYNNPKPTTVTLNKDGLLVGNYIFPGSYSNTEMSFNSKGVVTKFVEREKNGKVTEKVDFDTELIEIASKYLAGELTDEDLFDQHITIDTVNARNYIEFGRAFENDIFIMPSLGGDKTYDESSSSSKRIYGLYILAQRIHVVPYHQHKEWPGTIGDIETRISRYQHFLDYYSIEISKEDRKAITNLMDSLSSELEVEKQTAEAEKQYWSIREKVNNYIKTRKVYGYGETSSIINLTLKPEDNKLDSLKKVIEKGFPENSMNDMLELRYKNIDYSKKIEPATQYLEITETEYLPLLKKVNDIKLAAEAADNALQATNWAFQKVHYGEQVSGFPLPEKTILGIYKLYKALRKEQLEKIKTIREIPQLKDELNKLTLLANKATQLINKDNSALIKATNKAKTIDEMFLLFMK